MIRFVSQSEFIRYRAIKVPPSNYFNTLRGAWAEWSSAIWAIWAELSSEIGTTWTELSWADFFYGLSCPGPTCLWADLS